MVTTGTGDRSEVDSRLDALQQGLLAVIRSALTAGCCLRHPARFALHPGDAVGVVGGTGPDTDSTWITLAAELAAAGATAVHLSAHNQTDRAVRQGLGLVVAVDHSLARRAQTAAATAGVPVLLPGYLHQEPARLCVSLCPVPTLTVQGGRQRYAVLDCLELSGPMLAPGIRARAGLTRLLVRPSLGGLLLYASGPSGESVRSMRAPLTVQASSALRVVADGRSRVHTPDRYWISPAQPPLYRLHAHTFR